MADLRIEYQAEPTPSAFHHSNAFVRLLMGPIGSGKSVTGFQEIFRIASMQKPQYDGIRRSRHAVIRNTYPELKTTSIKTYEDWFGEVSTIRWDSPITAMLRVNDIECEIMFLALDKPKDVKRLLSLELTTAFINECREVPQTVIEMCTGRVGRYPPKKDGGPVHSCVFMDTNPPDDDHWIYHLFEEQRPDGYEIFKQPPALLSVRTADGIRYIPNPKAEAVKHQPLGFEYWMRQIPGKKPEWIKVYVEGKYGSSQDGRPCYPTYNDGIHCSKEPLTFYRGYPLLIGFDFGRTPAAIVGQMTPLGQLMILDEIVVDSDGQGMSLRKFLSSAVRPYINQHYPGVGSFFVCGDPAGMAGGQQIEETCFDILAQEGFPGDPASTNLIGPRLETVEYFLNQMIDGQPGLLLDPKVKILRKGFLGGYQFERVQVSGDTRYKDSPQKNRYSHPHDALQYLCDMAKHGSVRGGKYRSRPLVATGAKSSGWT